MSFGAMLQRAKRDGRSPIEVRADLSKRRESFDKRCHARSFYFVNSGAGVMLSSTIEKVTIGCSLPGGHAGPHETRIDGELWQFQV